MKRVIILSLIILSSCSTQSVIKTKYLTIPERYLECDYYPDEDPLISESSEASARHGDYKPMLIELIQISITSFDKILLQNDYKDAVLEVSGAIIRQRHKEQRYHDTCVNNAADAREYQEQMTNNE